MPIRFRCAYCNQLMGIARRKAGTVVKCPNCFGQVVVPPDEGEEEAPKPQPPPLFERSDIDEVLKTTSKGPPPQVPISAAPAGYPVSFPPVPVSIPSPKTTGQAGEQLDFPANLPFPAAPPGIVLSPALAMLLGMAVLVAVALAFLAGIVVGRHYFQPSPNPEPIESRLPEAGLRL